MQILPISYQSMKSNKTFLCLLFAGFNACVLLSQDLEELEPLITDRPDATESPFTMPKGFFQGETGVAYERFEQHSISYETFTYNTTLLRYGLLNNLELRLGWDFVEGSTKVNGTHLENVTSGFSPLLFGFKTSIANEQGCFPQIGFLGHLYLPFTASEDYQPETTGADFRFSFAHTLSETSSLSYNLGAGWGNDIPAIAYLYSVSYGYGITEKLAAYAEIYGDFPEHSKANHFWDVGLTYLLSNNLQLDATLGTSFTKGQDVFLSSGVSYRIPKH